jgi:predicted TIM-barrel fold metal-dependent hydrolase
MRNGLRIFDADAHVIEPGDVFAGMQPPGIGPIDIAPDTPMTPCGDWEKLRDQVEHGFDAPSYLRAMDRQGIDAAVLYPSLGLFMPFQPELDAAASTRACRAYNEWIASYCGTNPARLAGVGVVPLADPALAATVAKEAAALRLVGVLARPNYLHGRNLGDRAFDALYDTLEATSLVLAVHEGLGVRAGTTIGADRFPRFTLRHLCSHPMEQMAAMASLMLDGALERHPGMRVAFLESGTAWLPYWLARLDQHRHWMRETLRDLSLAPSDYFARQCTISSDPEDKLVGMTARYVGADHIVWASDFPHPDAEFPNAVDEFLRDAPKSGLAGADLARVLWETPVGFYRLEGRMASAAGS